MERKTLDQFLEDINPILEDGKININYGECDGDTVVVFDTWKDVHYVEGYLNGFEGLTDKPYIPSGKTITDLLEEAKVAAAANPNHYGYKREVKALTTYLLYLQYMSGVEEPISLDDYDFDVVFSDEYDQCCNCGAILRTSPDSYSWTAPLFVDCEGYACDECVSKGDFDDYVLEEYCNEEKTIPDSIDTDRLGLVKINDDSYQNGFHSGMDDSPKPIIKALNKEDIHVWFKVHPSQFYIDFDVYVRKDDADRAKCILMGTDTFQGYSTSNNLAKALRESNEESAKVSGEGIRYTTVDVEKGTSTTRLVSEEEFIEGIKD